ncbi:hypothetical protein TthAA37_03950 [Thermus thermophilus]|nr:hypothetical protein TthAA37_03950 [Thermus thermophilus]
MEEAEARPLQDLAQDPVFLPGEGVKPLHLLGPPLRRLQEGGQVFVAIGQGPFQGGPVPEGVEAHVPRHLPLLKEDEAVLQLLGEALEVPGLRGEDAPLGALVHVAEEPKKPREVLAGHGPDHAPSLPPGSGPSPPPPPRRSPPRRA